MAENVQNPIEFLQSPMWRIKNSIHARGFINEWTQKKMLYEIDMKVLQRKLILVKSPQEAGQLTAALSNKKNEYLAVCETVQAAEDLLVEFEKAEAQKLN